MKLKRIIAAVTAVGIFAASFGVMNVSAQEEKKQYIVLLSEPAVLSEDRAVLASDEETQNSARDALYENQSKIKKQIDSLSGASLFSEDSEFKSLSFTDVLNGFTVEATAAEAAKIRNLDGVKTVVEDGVIYTEQENSGSVSAEETAELSGEEIADTQEYAASVINAGNLIGADKAYERGYNGEGRAIAVIDSELDYNNDYFALTNPQNAKYTKSDIEKIITEKKVNAAADKNIEANQAYRSAKIPFAYNYIERNTDVNGKIVHGSHVSGIAAGNLMPVGGNTDNGFVSGIAPEAQILFFRVVDDNGKMGYSKIIAAIDDAAKFGVDAVNLSIGADGVSENYEALFIYGEAVKNAVQAGISMVFSAGNSWKNYSEVTKPDVSITDNSKFPYAANIGSVHSTYTYSEYLTDELGNKYYCDTRGKTTPHDFTDIVLCASGSEEDIKAADVSGKTAVIPLFYGIEKKTAFEDSYKNARAAGAAMVVVVNVYNQVTNGNKGYDIPVFYMPRDVYEALIKNMEENNVTKLKYEAKSEIFHRSEAPLRSSYSSYGYSDNLDISVDFSTPGGNIYSSVPYNKMQNLSGTSMSAPVVTGAMALMHEFAEYKYPWFSDDTRSYFINAILASTSDTIYEENGALSSPRAVGSGLINLEKAMDTNVILLGIDSSSSKINLGSNLEKEFEVSFSVFNIGDTTVTFDSASVELSSDDYKYYESVDKYAQGDAVRIDCTASGFEPITVGPYDEQFVTMTIKADDDDIAYFENVMTNGFFIDGKVTLSSSTGDNCDIGIPFSGFYGDWNAAPIVDVTNIENELCLKLDIGDTYIEMKIQNTDDGPVLYVSENPDEDFMDGKYTLLTALERNAYMDIAVGDKILMDTKFMGKKSDSVEMPITTAELSELAKSGAVIYVDMMLPYCINNEEDKIQMLDIKVLPDNEKPQLTVETYQDGDKTMAKVKMSDNNMLGGLYYKGIDKSGKWVDEYKEGYKKECEFDIDITGLMGVSFEAVDIALNKTGIYSGVEITEENGELVVKNKSADDIKGTLIIAIYDENGVLTGTKIPYGEGGWIPAFEKLSYDVSGIGRYKAFFWDSVNGMTPLCGSYDSADADEIPAA